MPPGTSITLATPIDELPDVWQRRVAAMHRLGIHTAGDLIKHLPHRWEYHAGQNPIGRLQVDQIATAVGEVATCQWVPRRGRMQGRFTAKLEDETGLLELVWFNAGYLRDKLVPGMRIAVTGKTVEYRDAAQMVNPKWRVLGEDEQRGEGGVDHAGERYRGVYPATEELSSDVIGKLIDEQLDVLLPQIDDHLAEAYRTERGMPTLAEAYRMMHRPADPDEVKAARRRLAYDELLLLQTGLAMKRAHTRKHYHAPALSHSDAIDRHIRDRFPFALTAAQDKVVGEIAVDLGKSEPMNRLLQGDVGSGKTVVALYAMMLAAADRKQAALMAPTELLAEQHYASIGAMLLGSSVNMALLTGSLTADERQSIRAAIRAGSIDLVIGTQALLTEGVEFADLAVVVVDEQHRFGVQQRAAIRAKTSDPTAMPHTLVMTATPIPRTLSLTLFGDVNVSTIAALPPGRQPIDTRVVTPDKTDDVYRYIADRVAAGEQLYIVLPAIDEGEANLKAVRSHARHLEATWLAGRRIATVHGQLKRETRAAIMDRFRRGRIDALVATTVIEVGVDVPNASLMIVEHAERFGLAQLHQLRGRVGRGEKRSLCVFIGEPTTEDAQQRLGAIAETTDGFAIAEADLAIRGMGELIGTRQSGLPPLRIAEIDRDLDLLRLAKRDAEALIEADPSLKSDSHKLLRARLFRQYREALGLGDVA